MYESDQELIAEDVVQDIDRNKSMAKIEGIWRIESMEGVENKDYMALLGQYCWVRLAG